MIDFTGSSAEAKKKIDNLESTPLCDYEGPVLYTDDEYHAADGFSSTDLKYMLKSPAHFKYFVVDKNEREKPEPSSALRFGTYAHEVFLLGKLSSFAVMPDFKPEKKLTKKAQVEAWCAEHEGKEIISQDVYDKLAAMHEVLKASPVVQEIMDGADIEKCFYYQDVETGLKLKFKPDIMNIQRGFIADYKTTESANKYEFRKAIARYYYHLSASHYLAGVSRVFGVDLDQFIFIPQEKKEPFSVGTYQLSKGDITKSFELRRKILRKIDHHLQTDKWPGYDELIESIHLPGYAFEFEE